MARGVLAASLFTVVSFVAGCEYEQFEAPDELLPPMALQDHAVWIDTGNDRALYLDVTASFPRPQVDVVAVPTNPTLIQPRNAHPELLLLSLGDERDGSGILSVLDESGVDRRYNLGTRFDTLTQSSDGRYVFARVQGETGDILFNPNEVALVDLDGSGDDAVTQRTLRSIGSGPQAVVFSPPMELAGEERRLAVVLSSSQVALMDLNHPTRPEFTVELTQSANVGLNQVRFDVDEQKIYLLGTSSNDVYAITLLPAGENRENDFEPSLNTLGVGEIPRDMTLYGSGAASRLLAVGGNAALIIEAGSNRITRVELGVNAQRIHLFEGTAPFDDEVEERAFIYAPQSSQVAFLDLDEVEDRTTRNVETLQLSGGISQLLVLEGDLVLVLHQDRSLSLLNLVERTAAPIRAQVDVGATIHDANLNRLWVGAPGSQAIGYLDLDDFHPGQVDLGLPTERLLLFTAGRAKRLLVVHPNASGSATVLDAERPEDRDRAVTLNGFFFAGALD